MQILPADPLAAPAASVITYDALDLIWLDGLDDIRALLTLPPLPPHAQKAPESFKCQSMADLTWYCSWKGIALDAQFLTQVPVVATADLLQHLGVPQQHAKAILPNLTVEGLAGLRRMVLPEFSQQAVALMANQLPELQLTTQLQGKLLFAG